MIAARSSPAPTRLRRARLVMLVLACLLAAPLVLVWAAVRFAQGAR